MPYINTPYVYYTHNGISRQYTPLNINTFENDSSISPYANNYMSYDVAYTNYNLITQTIQYMSPIQQFANGIPSSSRF